MLVKFTFMNNKHDFLKFFKSTTTSRPDGIKLLNKYLKLSITVKYNFIESIIDLIQPNLK